MKNHKINKTDPNSLREKAEEILKNKASTDTLFRSEAEMLRLIHEFDVHQIELELQNNELKQAISEAKDATALYDFAPTGYLSLSREGKILRLNLSGAAILGKERSVVINSNLASYIRSETKPAFNLFLEKAFSSKTKQTCDVTLLTIDNESLYIHIEGIITETAEYCLITLSDISERRQAEVALAQQNAMLSKITQFSVDLSILPSSGNIELFICKQIKEITGALVVTYSEYDAESRMIVPKHIEAESGMLKKVVNLLGRQVQKVYSPVDEATYLKMTNQIIGKSDNLTELTFGAIPRPAGAMISGLINADRYVVIVYLIEGKLYGTSLLAMGKNQPDPSYEILRNIAFLVAVSLRRIRAEESLKENENKFRSLFEGTNDAILILDGNKCVDCNHRTEIILNCRKDDLISHTIEEFAPFVLPDGKPTESKVQVKINLVLNGEPQVFQGRHLRMDGTFFDSDISLSKVDINGSTFIQVILRDITDRKKAEMALQVSEANLSAILNATDEAVFLISADETVLTLNETAARHLGGSIGKMINHKLSDLLLADIMADRRKFIKHVQEKAKPVVFEDMNNSRWFKNHIYPIFDQFGKVSRMAIFARDITEQKRTQDALSESEARFRRLYESASLAIFQSTPGGKVISVNPSFAKMFGYDSPGEVKDSIKNISIEIFADPTRRDEILSLSEETPELKTFENIYRRKDSSTFIGQLNITRIFDDEGRFEHLEGFIEDITQRKRDEEALLNSKLQYDKLAANIPVGVYVLHSKADGNFKLDYVSPRMAEMLGLSVESLLNDARLIYKAIYPGDQDGFVQLNEDGILLKKAFDWTGRILSDGKIKWMHVTSSPDILENDDILWHGLVVDITKEKLSEDAINEAHNRLLNIASNVPGLVYQYKLRPDGTSCFPFVSEGIKEIYRVSPEEVLKDASKMYTNVHPDDLDEVITSVQISAKELSPWKHEYRLSFTDGTTKTLLGNAIPQLEQDGSILWHGFVTDITEQKLSEQALNASEARFKNIFERNNAIMLLIEPVSGLILDANQAAADFYGYSLTRLREMNVDEINLLPSEEIRAERLKAAQEKRNNFIFKHRLANGEERIVEVYSSPIEFPDKPVLFSIIHDITERKQVEDALNSSQQILEGIINTIPVRVFWKDKNLNYLGCNSIFLKDAGFTDEDEIIGKDDYQMSWRNQAELYRSDDKEVIESGKAKLNIEEPQTSDDGSFMALLTNKLPLRNPEGEISGVLGTYMDITERKQAEEKLRDSEKRYRQLVETANEAILVAQGYNFKFVNPSTSELSGYTEEELLAIPFIEFIHPDDRALVTDNYLKRLNGEMFHPSYSFRFIGKGNNVRWVEMTGVKIDWDGQPATLNFANDVTARKLAEEALIESERHANALIGAIPDLLFIINLEGIFIDYRADLRDLSYQTESIIGKRNRDIMPSGFADLIDEKIRLTLQKGAMQVFEYKMEIPLRGLVEYEARMVPYGLDQVAAIVRDVTERKKAEAEINQKNEDLIKANSEKDKFFSIIAHDLRGPIGGFMGLTERMAEGMTDMTLDELQNIARVMKNSSTNIYILLGNLLEWSRMQRGQTTFEPVTFLLLPKIQEIMLLTLDTANKKEISVRNTIPDDLLVFADENMLASIIRNLVTNAVKFTPQGGRISIAAKLRYGSILEISISDTGIGMNKNIIENLFNIDVNTSRKGTDGELSTGLGLMICKDFIEKHGGELKVVSQVGKGSTFSFTLPAETSVLE